MKRTRKTPASQPGCKCEERPSVDAVVASIHHLVGPNPDSLNQIACWRPSPPSHPGSQPSYPHLPRRPGLRLIPAAHLPTDRPDLRLIPVAYILMAAPTSSWPKGWLEDVAATESAIWPRWSSMSFHCLSVHRLNH